MHNIGLEKSLAQAFRTRSQALRFVFKAVQQTSSVFSCLVQQPDKEKKSLNLAKSACTFTIHHHEQMIDSIFIIRNMHVVENTDKTVQNSAE